MEDAQTVARRDLKFATLEDGLAELERLKGQDHPTTGNWTFYQILKHLADTIERSYEKDPNVVYPQIEARTTEVLFKRIQRSGKMSPGHKNPKLASERMEGDFAAELERLKDVIRIFRERGEDLVPDEHMGKMTSAQWEFIHAIHMALHLSFVRV